VLGIRDHRCVRDRQSDIAQDAGVRTDPEPARGACTHPAAQLDAPAIGQRTGTHGDLPPGHRVAGAGDADGLPRGLLHREAHREREGGIGGRRGHVALGCREPARGDGVAPSDDPCDPRHVDDIDADTVQGRLTHRDRR